MDIVKHITNKLTRDFNEERVNLDSYLFSNSKSRDVKIAMPQATLHPEKKDNAEHDLDLYKHLKFIFVLGRILGIIPYSSVFKQPSSYKNLYFQ